MQRIVEGLDTTKECFKKIFGGKNNRFQLPMRWDGNDFYLTLFHLYSEYIECLPTNSKKEVDLRKRTKLICDKILNVVREYLFGFPSNAYDELAAVMDEEFIKNPMYADAGQVGELYRMVKVEDNVLYERERIFHVPYHLRSKISTCRYSISGYPSLYLSSSIDLCNEETNLFCWV